MNDKIAQRIKEIQNKIVSETPSFSFPYNISYAEGVLIDRVARLEVALEGDATTSEEDEQLSARSRLVKDAAFYDAIVAHAVGTKLSNLDRRINASHRKISEAESRSQEDAIKAAVKVLENAKVFLTQWHDELSKNLDSSDN